MSGEKMLTRTVSAIAFVTITDTLPASASVADPNSPEDAARRDAALAQLIERGIATDAHVSGGLVTAPDVTVTIVSSTASDH